MEPLSDKEIISRIFQGRKETFRLLVERYYSRVAGFLRRSNLTQETVDDLCQETFLRVYEKLSTFDLNRPFLPWILKLAYHQMIQYFRSKNRVWKFDPLIDEEYPAPPAGTHDFKVLLDQMVDLLPEPFRILFLLRHGLELSYEEIADVLGEPMGTVKTHLYRARAILQNALEKAENREKAMTVKDAREEKTRI